MLIMASHPRESSFFTLHRHENLTSHTDGTAPAIYHSGPKCSYGETPPKTTDLNIRFLRILNVANLKQIFLFKSLKLKINGKKP
jgi:hypothetical protein